jgi:hypothetical protein
MPRAMAPICIIMHIQDYAAHSADVCYRFISN